MSRAERKVQHDLFWYATNTLQLEAIGGVEFTQREVDIIACILSGKSAKKIAAFLSISPKTVENHIRNIMLKLGCRTQENIIDFVERSNKFISIKRHYSNLLLQSFFEQELRKIAELVENYTSNCVVAYAIDCKEYANFVTRFSNHLKICGINAVIKNNKQEAIPIEKPNYIIYVNACTALNANIACPVDETSNIENIILLGKKYSAPIISIMLNKDAMPISRHNLLFNDDMILIEQSNYYLLVFETLKKILKINIDNNIADFIRQMDELSGLAPLASNNVSQTEQVVIAEHKKISNPSVWTWIISAILILLIFFVVAFSQVSSNRQQNFILSGVLNWMREGESCVSEVAEKYLEGLEAEESKLGKLDSNFAVIKFLGARRNFIKLSNMLVNLQDDDIQKTSKLIKLLHDKFPLHNRTNEKIHKLFFALASYYGKLQFIDELMEGAQISFGDFKDYYGNTAPMLAAAGNSVETFKWLAKKDALFFNHTNVEGNSALILAALNLPADDKLDSAAREASIAILKKVIENDRNSVKIRGHKGCTPLLVAGAKGNIAAVEYLLNLQSADSKAQLKILQEERNSDGNNIMMLAAYNGREHLIEWLHMKGISILEHNKYHTSAFMQAASGGNIKTLDIIYRLRNDGENSAHDLLLEKNDFGQTALFLAVHDNHVNAFQWIKAKLLKNIFNNNNEKVSDYIRNVRNADGDTLLHVLINGMSDTNRFAESALNTGLIDILLDYLDVNVHALLDDNKPGDTPLMRAAYYGNLTIVKYLIEKCAADPTELNFRGEDAIDYAAMGGHGQYFKVIEYLWELKAKQDGKSFNETKRQCSAELFLTAAQHGQKSVIEWLLKDNPELIETRTANGDNALSLAVKNEHIDIIEFIFSWDRKTAVRLAIEKKSNAAASIIEQLISEEKNGKSKNISLSKYLEQKVGFSMWQSNNRVTKHSDSNYRWRQLDIGIKGLSTSMIQPWSPYYLHYDSRLKEKVKQEIN